MAGHRLQASLQERGRKGMEEREGVEGETIIIISRSVEQPCKSELLT